jgi:hypothetical protein
MELEGRYAILWLADAGARMFFGMEPSGLGQEYRWLIGGKVAGDGALGLWMKIEHLEPPDGRPLAPPADPILVRWEWIITASVLPDRPKDYRKAAFRLGDGAAE